MRGLKSTLALLVVLIGLGANIYFFLAKKPDSTITKQEKLFPNLEASKIDDLKVKSESGEVTSLKKEGGPWKVVAQIQVTAADSDAPSLANALGDIEIVRVVDENPTDLKPFGLDAPRIDVENQSSEPKTAGHLLVGPK